MFQQHVAPTAEDLLFKLEPCLSVNGVVRDAETRKRVENATLQFGAVDPSTGEVSLWQNPPELGSSTGISMGYIRVNLPVAGEGYKIRVESPGYQTFVSRIFRRDEKVVSDYDVTLVPGMPAGRMATAVRADGKPLAGARVYTARRRSQLSLTDGRTDSQESGARDLVTTPDGTFALPQFAEPWAVLVLGEDGYALANKEELDKSLRMQAKPYARVEGRFLIGREPQARREVHLDGHLQGSSTMMCTIFLNQKATTDIQGRFMFEQVIPINSLRVTQRRGQRGPGTAWTLGAPVRTEAGATAHVDLGGSGRPLIGRVEPPEGWTKPVDFTADSEAYIETNQPFTPYPPSLFRGKTTLNGGYWSDWLHRWQESPEARDYVDRRVAVRVGLEPDGSFRIDDVPPGDYRLAIRVPGEPTSGSFLRRRDAGPFARIVKTFTIPAMAGGRSDEPLDFGVMRLIPRSTLKVGEPVPAFEVTTVDGNKLAYPRDFQGKVVLLDFSTLWDMQSALQIARLNDVNQKHGKNPRFAMLSLTSADDTDETRKYIADKGEPWPQAILGPLSNTISTSYGIDDENVPAAILIGPDGKLIDFHLSNRQLSDAIGAALGKLDK